MQLYRMSGYRLRKQTTVFLSPPQMAGCPILRSFVAMGGMNKAGTAGPFSHANVTFPKTTALSAPVAVTTFPGIRFQVIQATSANATASLA